QDTADTVEKDEDGGAVLVGYGVRGGAETRRRKPRTVQSVPAPTQPVRPASVPAASAAPVIAKPPTRKLAKDLGVDLATVIGSGLAGEVTRDDVVQSAKQASVFRNLDAPVWSGGREERIPVKG